MILTKTITTRIVPLNIDKLKEFYNIKINDIIEIDINHLSEKSPIEITCQCEICGSIKNLQYRKYIKNKSRHNYYSCKKCKNLKTNITKELLYNDPFYNNSKKMIQTKEENGIYIPINSMENFKQYRKIVNRFTYKSKKMLFSSWTGFDYYDNEYIKDNFKLLSKDRKYPTVDHKISLYEGFNKNIPPYIIGGIENICITKRYINSIKNNSYYYIHKL